MLVARHTNRQRQANMLDTTRELPVATHTRWDQLQQPVRPSQVNKRYLLLLAALDTGWQIDAPVVCRPRTGTDAPALFHVILRHAIVDSTRLLLVPDSADMQRFVRDEGIAVINTQQAAAFVIPAHE